MGLVATQKAEVQLPRGRVTGLALEDCKPATFPQENVALSDRVHNLVEKLQEVLLVLRASRGERRLAFEIRDTHSVSACSCLHWIGLCESR